MPVDWFTVGAQAVNFLLLVWLLKRFLYQPILHAIDAREERMVDVFTRRLRELEGEAKEALAAILRSPSSPARTRLHRPARRDQHRGVFHGGRPQRADRVRRLHPPRARTASCRSCCAAPPGREAFPGDIFYIHSRLLERATHLREERGGGSLTALPILETEAQNISAYIPTHLISITDGQIYLSPTLLKLGVLPAVDVGKSVSRVGGKAQRAAYRAVAGDLKLAYARFEELEAFARYRRVAPGPAPPRPRRAPKRHRRGVV